MVKNHIKRISAPRRWDILRKEKTFISRPNAGRDLSLSVALNTVMKDMLDKSENTKESKYIIRYKSVLVNGVRRYDEKFPVGFMDVVTFPDLGESYRLLVNSRDKIFMHKIAAAESTIKLSKVSDKKHIKGGIVQINCSDGRNFLFKSEDPVLKTLKLNDSIVYSIPEQKFKELLKMEKGAIVYLYKGKHIGHTVKVDDFEGNNIIFKLDGESFETKRAYAIVLGKDNLVISMPDWKAEKEKAPAPAPVHAPKESKEGKEPKEAKEKKSSAEKKQSDSE
jgi:small subunit ribosomal protein S4e